MDEQTVRLTVIALQNSVKKLKAEIKTLRAELDEAKKSVAEPQAVVSIPVIPVSEEDEAIVAELVERKRGRRKAEPIPVELIEQSDDSSV